LTRRPAVIVASENATDGNVAVRRVDVQLMADPCLLISLGVAFDANVTMSRQIGEHLAQGHVGLAFQPAGRLSRRLLALARTTALAGCRLRRGRFGLFGALRLFMAFDRCRIARDMTNQTIHVALPDQGFVHTRGQLALGEFGERARERRFAGNLGRTRPTAQPPQRLVGLNAFDQHPRGRQVEDRLGHEGPGQRRPLGQRASGKAMPVRHESLEPRHIHYRDQDLMRPGQETNRFLEKREEFPLKLLPVCG
jgi:hypothetical protein